MQQRQRRYSQRPRQRQDNRQERQEQKEVCRPVNITMQSLLEGGGHFGTKKSRWNPKTKKYIYGLRSGVYIINLEKTMELWETAKNAIKKNIMSGGDVLFVGTKRQLKDLIKEEASLCGCPYINDRWLGGTLTNFDMVRKSVKRLEKLEAFVLKEEAEGGESNLTKKELGLMKLEVEKLTKKFGGLRGIKKVPTMIFVIDSVKENIAVLEARRLHIPIVSILDTDCDPDYINYPIPSNDDAFSTSALFIRAVCDIVLEAKQLREQEKAMEQFNADCSTVETKVQQDDVKVEKAHRRRFDKRKQR